jgi:N6-L-threonylcarbamoyladenine synthase
MEMLLALESSCDETAIAIIDTGGDLRGSVISSQAEIHKAYGGVVPEVASRRHLAVVRPLFDRALQEAGARLEDMVAFAATAGPGLASSLLVGNTLAKSLALALDRPFLAVNHLEGHLLSPFIGDAPALQPNVSLVASGGHTMLVRVDAPGRYTLLGRTRDDAAGEAFDKGARLLGLPYPGGPEIDRLAVSGRADAHDFPRSFLDGNSLEFSFSGLKTSLRYLLPKLDLSVPGAMEDVCASYQEAIVSVLVEKTILAARQQGLSLVAASGGVTCNVRFRRHFSSRCDAEGLAWRLAEPRWCTDNAAMIAWAALLRWREGVSDPLERDVDPNLPLAFG